MTDNYLFVNGDMFSVLEHQKTLVKRKVQELDAAYLSAVNEQQLAEALIDEMKLEVPVIREDEIHIADHGETQVDVSRDPNRMIFDRSRPFHISGNKTVIAVPFDGDPDFFKIKPNTFTYNPPRGVIVDHQVQLTYTRTDQDAESLKREYQQDVNNIKQYLQCSENRSHNTMLNSQR